MNKANTKANAKKMYPSPPAMAFGKRLLSPSAAKSPSNATSLSSFNEAPLKSAQSPIDPTKRNFKISMGQSAADFNTTRLFTSQSPSSANSISNKPTQPQSSLTGNSTAHSISSILNKATERKSKDVEIQTELILESNAEIEILTLTEIAAIQRERDGLEAMVQQSIDSALQMKEKVRFILLIQFSAF